MIVEQRTPPWDANPVAIPRTIPQQDHVFQNAGGVFQETVASHTRNSFDLNVTGPGAAGTSLLQPDPEIDDSNYPILDSETAAISQVTVSDGRWSSDHFLPFLPSTPPSMNLTLNSLVPGSYAEYSWNRVHEIFSDLDDGATPDNHRVFNTDQTRRNKSIIPHSSLTCHAVGEGSGINTIGGHLRIFAITPRHCLQIGHSGPTSRAQGTYPGGSGAGNMVRFVTVDDVKVERRIVANVNLLQLPGYPDYAPEWGIEFGVWTPRDVRLLVLDSDLPQSISPAPFVGDWFFNYVETESKLSCNIGAFGFVSFNRDTHIVPQQFIGKGPAYYDYLENTGAAFGQTEISHAKEFSAPYPVLVGQGYGSSNVTLEGYERYSYKKFYDVLPSLPTSTNEYGVWYPDRPFHHVIRGGDSGSPMFWPVSDGRWAVGAGTISANTWRPAAINALIAHINDELGISGTYEVEVAPDPTA